MNSVTVSEKYLKVRLTDKCSREIFDRFGLIWY